MCSCGDKETLIKEVNGYYYSKNVIIVDNTFINTLNNRVVGYYEVKKNRHRFLLDI